MDPFLALIVTAIATGAASVVGDLIKDGALKPLLEPAQELSKQWIQRGYREREKQVALANAVRAAIADTGGVAGEDALVEYAREIGLERLTLKQNRALLDRVIALSLISSSPDDAALVSDALLRELNLQPNQRAPFARFLYYLREQLNALEEYQPLLRLAHERNVENAAHIMIFEIAGVRAGVEKIARGMTRDADGRPALRTLPGEVPWQNRDEYLGALVKEFERLRLPLFDTRLHKPGQEPITLDQIYTALDVVERSPNPLGQPDLVTLGRRRGTGGNDEMIDAADARLTALQAISDDKSLRVVLLGYPGSGKSTFINFLALGLVQEQIKSDSPEGLARLEGWTQGALFPARIVLRDLVAWADKTNRAHASAQTVWEYLAYWIQELGYEENSEPLKNELRRRGVVFFDGLDEVRQADRRRDFIKKAIEKFADANGHCRIVVTCRPYAYREPVEPNDPDWRLDGFGTFTLAEFNPEQTEQFIRTWYQIVGPRQGWDETRIDSKTNELLTAARRPHHQKLASRPLLLTQMATLDTFGQLPEDRADLYDRTIKLLLDLWEKERGGGLYDFGLDAESVQRVLSRVAYTAHERQGASADKSRRELTAVADISEDELIQAFKGALGNSLDRAKDLVDYISERGGLLDAQGKRTYTFPHRSFQEFLAAAEAVQQEGFPDDLVARVREDMSWWREVYLLAVGIARKPRFANAVDALDALCGDDFSLSDAYPNKSYDALLAAEAADEVDLKTRASEVLRWGKTLRRLQEWLVEVVVRDLLPNDDRAQAGRLLSKLGDIRDDVACAIPFTVPVAPGAFVMGTSETEARAVIEKYGKDWERWVKRELPDHPVRLDAYRIGKYPVTNAQFRLFVESDGYTNSDYWTDEGWEWKTRNAISKPASWDDPQWNLDNHPVVGVSWYEADAYCEWLTARDKKENGGQGRTFRLPTEAEWEKAASWDDSVRNTNQHKAKRVYAWGDEYDGQKGNVQASGIGRTSAVGLFSNHPSPCGAMDMTGNVWEWCADWFDETYYANSPQENPQGPPSGNARVLRGAAFANAADYARCAYRYLDLPASRYVFDFGFRVAVPPA